MAAFRLVNLPAIASRSACTHLFIPSPPPLPPNPFLLSLTTKPQMPSLQIFLVQAHAEAQSQPVVQPEEDEVPKTKLVVQNVPWTCTVDDIRRIFQKFGTIVDIEFSMHNKIRNRGLAFVSMASYEEAVAALGNLESIKCEELYETSRNEIEGRSLRLNWAKPRKAKPPMPPPQSKSFPVHNLFVANLSFEAGSQDLKDFFNSNNANIVSAEVIYHDNPSRPAGYGFVSFNTKEDAEAALVAFQGKEFMGRPLKVARSRSFLRRETKATIESRPKLLK
ncbi:hypothetical protein OROGR_026178 [Orobanche gracilis]